MQIAPLFKPVTGVVVVVVSLVQLQVLSDIAMLMMFLEHYLLCRYRTVLYNHEKVTTGCTRVVTWRGGRGFLKAIEQVVSLNNNYGSFNYDILGTTPT